MQRRKSFNKGLQKLGQKNNEGNSKQNQNDISIGIGSLKE
jgi:hypothetical protein